MGSIKVLDREVHGKFGSVIKVRVKVADDGDCIVVITIPAGSGVTFASTGTNITEQKMDCTTDDVQIISFVLESEDPENMVIRATYSLKDGSDSDFNRIFLSI